MRQVILIHGLTILWHSGEIETAESVDSMSESMAANYWFIVCFTSWLPSSGC